MCRSWQVLETNSYMNTPVYLLCRGLMQQRFTSTQLPWIIGSGIRSEVKCPVVFVTILPHACANIMRGHLQLASSMYLLRLSLQSAGNGDSPNSARCLLQTVTPTARSTQRTRRNVVLGLEGEARITPAKLAEGRKQNLSYLLRRVNTDAHSSDALGYQIRWASHRRLHHHILARRAQRSKVLLPIISPFSSPTHSATLIQNEARFLSKTQHGVGP